MDGGIPEPERQLSGFVCRTSHVHSEKATVLCPTSTDLLREDTHPYFLWWTDVTVGRLRVLLRSSDLEERAYWLGALLREANSRDVWLFVTPDEIRRDWPHLVRHVGRSRSMWAWLLDLDDLPWPPPEAGRV